METGFPRGRQELSCKSHFNGRGKNGWIASAFHHHVSQTVGKVTEAFFKPELHQF